MPPVGRVDITAADVVGTPPITSIELSDNGGDPTADDLHDIAAMALANDDYRAGQIAQLETDLGDYLPLIGGTLSGLLEMDAGATVANGQLIQLNGTATIAVDPARTYQRTIDHPPIYDAANWLPALDAESLLPIFASQSISAGTTEIVWAWRPPTGATVTEVSVFLTPDTSPTHGGVPSVVLAVAKLTRAAVSAANTATQTDASGSVGAYETPHDLEVTGLSITFSEGDLLLVRLSPETGANAETNLKVAPPIVTFTRVAFGEE